MVTVSGWLRLVHWLLDPQCLRFLFFFSSRRRHTRSDRDWSSDVCSSDLNMGAWRAIRHRLEEALPQGVTLRYAGRPWRASPSEGYPTAHLREQDRILREALKIGRASCRERG